MKKRLRIAFVGRFGSWSVNGVENAGYQLALELVSQGCDVFFYTIGDVDKFFFHYDGVYYRFFQRSRGPFLISKTYWRYIVSNLDRIDVYHIHSVFVPQHLLIGYLVNRQRIPYVITPHGGYISKAIQHTMRKSRWMKLFKWLYVHLLEARLIERASAIIALTEQEKIDLRYFRYTGRISVIPNLIPKTSVVQSSSTQTESQFSILYMGRYDVACKGLFFLLDVFNLVSKRLDNTRLLLYGSGKDKQRLVAKVHHERIPNVTISDPVFGMSKIAAIQTCTLYCQSSTFEAFGMSIAEAMAAGRPVAITRHCYISSILKSKNLGLVLSDDPKVAADEMVSLLLNPDERRRQGEALRALAMNLFNSEKVAEQTIDLYREVILERYEKRSR